MTRVILLVAAVLPLAAQDIKLPESLNKLADKATEVVDVTLDGPLLKLASKFLEKDDPEQAKVKQLVNGLKGIYVKSFEFEKEGMYSTADIEEIRKQLRAPGWSRIVGVLSKKDGENADIYLKLDGENVAGLVILAVQPRELTVVNIVGHVQMDQLSELGGHFGIPDVEVPHEKKKAAAGKD